MSIQPPTDHEVREILNTICHAEKPISDNFRAFLKFYQHATCARLTTEFFLPINTPVLPSHSAICQAVSILRYSCCKTQVEFCQDVFPQLDPADRERVTRMIVKVAFMVDCASRNEFSANYRIQNNEAFPVKWHANQTFIEFFHSAFPTSPESSFSAADTIRDLKAWKLRLRHGILIVPTDDLAQHLLYDRKARTLSVFHQVAFLKAHIQHTVELSLSETVGISVKKGSLPPQLLLETLFSIYYILFPLSVDKKSAKLAKRLINDPDERFRFDPNFLFHDGLIRPLPDDFQFIYWARRLKVLQNVITNPPPANRIISWVERHTSERNALTVAIIGVFLAVLFGLLSFIVGIAQLVVSIMAWKYPVQPTV